MKKFLSFILSLLASFSFFSNARVLEDCLLSRPPLPPDYYPPFVTGQGTITPPARSESENAWSITFTNLFSSDVIHGNARIRNGIIELYLDREKNISSIIAVNRSTGMTSTIYLQDDNIILISLPLGQVDGWWVISITTTDGGNYRGEFNSLGGGGVRFHPGFLTDEPNP